MTDRLALLTQENDNTNFTAIWVFTPSENTFKVYQEFSITGDTPATFAVQPPYGGYGAEVYSGPLHEGSKGPSKRQFLLPYCIKTDTPSCTCCRASMQCLTNAVRQG